MSLSRAEIKEALALAEKATPGEWEHHNWDQMEPPHVISHALWNGKDACKGHFDVPCTNENTEFIAASRELVPRLATELLKYTDAVEEAKRRLQDYCFCSKPSHGFLGVPLCGAHQALTRINEILKTKEKS